MSLIWNQVVVMKTNYPKRRSRMINQLQGMLIFILYNMLTNIIFKAVALILML